MRNYICEYTCVPKQDRIKSGMLVSGCIIAAIGMLAVSEVEFFLSPYFKLGAVAWVLVGALFALRLLSTGYVYSIFRDEESGSLDLVINELRFGSSRVVCRVSLFDIKELFEYDSCRKETRGKRKKQRRQKRPRAKGKCYNYCADILPSEYCLLRTSGTEEACIKFSPDKYMLEIIDRGKIK